MAVNDCLVGLEEQREIDDLKRRTGIFGQACSRNNGNGRWGFRLLDAPVIEQYLQTTAWLREI